jgi:hypothetical protein
VKTTFTFNPAYKNFVQGKTKIEPGLRDGAKRSQLIFGFICGVIFVAVASWWGTTTINDHLMLTMNEMTSGTVLDCYMAQVTKNEIAPSVIYSYEWNARHFVGSETIKGENQDCDLYEGKPVTVYVLGANPDLSQITVPRSRSILGLIPLLISLLPLWGVIFSLRQLRVIQSVENSYSRLSTDGVVLTGKVTDVHGQSNTENRWFDVEVQYEFITPSGQTMKDMYSDRFFGAFSSLEAIYKAQDSEDPNLPLVGMPVNILYTDDKNYILL